MTEFNRERYHLGGINIEDIPKLPNIPENMIIKTLYYFTVDQTKGHVCPWCGMPKPPKKHILDHQNQC